MITVFLSSLLAAMTSLSVSMHEPGEPVDHALALDAAYVAGWTASDDPQLQAAAVLPLFHESAVVHAGTDGPVLEGRDAIAGYWFPDDALPSTIHRFDHSDRTSSVSEETGAVTIQGQYYLHFTYNGSDTAQVGTYTHTSSPDDEGVWRFDRFSWTSQSVEIE